MFNPQIVETIGDPMAGVRRFWFDTALSMSQQQLAALLVVADPERITFGTDFPMAPPVAVKMTSEGLAQADMPDALRPGIGRGNAARLLGRAA